MPTMLRPTLTPFRIMLALFALYAVITVPSLLPRWGASPLGFALLAAWLAAAALAWPIAAGRIAARPLWITLAVAAVCLRIVALIVMDGRATAGDPMIYPMLARDLIAGGGLHFADPMTHTTFLALYPPGYPLFLAGWGALFGTGGGSIWASNVAIDLVIAGALGRLGAAVGQAAAGRAAAWLFATWPTFVLAAPFAQKEPLQTLLVLGVVLVLLRARTRVGWREAIALGLLAGLLALVQPGLAPLPAVLVIALVPLVGFRRMALLAARAVPVAVLVMAPWWARNAIVLHHFVPLTSTAGIGLWIGNNPNATGNWMPLPPSYNGMGEIEMSARAAAEAKAWILGHPAGFVRLSVTKLVRTMGVEQFTLLRFVLTTPPGPPALANALFPMLQGALWTALAATVALAGRARRAAGGDIVLLLGMAIMAQLLVFDLWFEFAERHRYVLMPFLFLIAGCALATVRLPAQAGRLETVTA